VTSRRTKLALTLILGLAGLGALVARGFFRHGFSAREEPWAVEAWAAARRMRHLAVPRGAREALNRLSASQEVTAQVLDPGVRSAYVISRYRLEAQVEDQKIDASGLETLVSWS
jgi:hypothetical protein